jgi:hypothetical protein
MAGSLKFDTRVPAANMDNWDLEYPDLFMKHVGMFLDRAEQISV